MKYNLQKCGCAGNQQKKLSVAVLLFITNIIYRLIVINERESHPIILIFFLHLLYLVFCKIDIYEN